MLLLTVICTNDLFAACWLGSLSQLSFGMMDVFFRAGDVSVIHFPPASSVISLILRTYYCSFRGPDTLLPPRLAMGIIIVFVSLRYRWQRRRR